MITCMGYTKEDWLAHLNSLFLIAHDGEDIPMSALIYAWQQPLTRADLEWAAQKIQELGD